MNTLLKKGLSLGLTVLLLFMSVPFVSFAATDFSVSVVTTENSATLSYDEKANATYAVTPSAGTYDSSLKTITGLLADTLYSVTVAETLSKTFTITKENENNYPLTKIDNQHFYYIDAENYRFDLAANDVTGNGSNYFPKSGTYVATKTNSVIKEFRTEKQPIIVTPTQYTITLNVQPGGTAFVNGLENQHEFKGRTEPYTIQYDPNTILEIKSFSNAGYAYNGFLVGATPTTGRTLTHTVVADANITVQFRNVDNVFTMPSYVTDGGFSGYHADGIDISTHDSKNDVLNATLAATPDKTLYTAGETAKISLPVTVTNGDNDTLVLNEVAYYQNSVKIMDAAFAPTEPASVTEYAIPSTVSGLLTEGFVYNSATNNFNKTFSYALVDIYNGDDAAVVLATATATLSVKYNATIYMTVDNAYELYINGVLQSPVYVPTPPSYPWQSVKWFDAVLKEGDVVAVKGTDEGGIAGFLADIIYDGTVYSTTRESFWRQSLVAETGWNNKGFVPTSNWSKTTNHTSTAWTGLTGLPTGLPSTWVWSANKDNDNTVYFRYVVGGANIDAPNTPPTIALNGNSSISLFVGDVYTEQNATATDKEDGALTPVVTGTVNKDVAGTYTITYTATDSKGAVATISRTVTVSEKAANNTLPTIALIGNSTINLFVGDVYTEQNATATDKEDGPLTPVLTGAVNTAVAGTYTITYTATDSKGAVATVSRTVIVSPKVIVNTPPTIALIGAASINLTVGDVYSEQGANATDKEDGPLTPVLTGAVNTAVAGTYTITYTAIDKNEATATVTRTIIVAPKTIIIENPGTIEDTNQEQPAQPATQPTTVDVPEEEIAAGGFNMINFDSYLDGTTPPAEVTSEELETVDVDDELIALAPTTLPKTGQLPVELFYGIGGLITAAGVFLKKKN